MARRDNELALELLLGRRVRDAQGRVVGRIEEFRATREEGHWAVTEFDIGPAAMLERLAVRHFGTTLGRGVKGYRATWEQLSFDDPDRPTLTCPVDELKTIR